MKSLSVIKPGIIIGNVITLCGGFFLGMGHHFSLSLLIITMIGMSLVIACGCTINNIVDRDIDKLMERTKNRVLVTGVLSPKRAALYAAIFGVLGFLVLALGTNWLTCLVSLVGLLVYVGTYTLWMKRKSIHSTIVGGIAGAVPPVVGYTAVTNRLDLGAAIVFFILFFWQIPHFYAISIFRKGDFSKASLPVMPLKEGVEYTQRSIRRYILLFTAVALLPTVFGYTESIYFIIALVSGVLWFLVALKKTPDERSWARKVFFYSILVITVISFSMAIKL